MGIITKLWLSITRRFTKSLILFMIVFLLGNILCASICITSSMNQLQKDFENQLGQRIEIIKSENFQYQKYEDEKHQTNLTNLLNNLKSIQEKGYLVYNDAQYILNGLYSKQLTFSNKYFNQQPCTLPNDILLYGISDPQMIDIIEQKIEIIQGRTFTQEEIINQKHVLIISEAYEYNGKKIKIGDIIQIDRIAYDENHEIMNKESIDYEIIGIFKKLESFDNSDSYNINNYEARIYLPSTTAIYEYQQLKKLYERNSNSIDLSLLQLHKIELKLSNANYEEKFNRLFNEQNPLINPEEMPSYQLVTSKDIYKQISQPLEFLSSISYILEIISFTSITILMSLTVLIFLKDRRYEIGVLYAMGETKLQIIYQHVLEILIISLFAISLSLVSGQQIGKVYANHLVQNQLESSKYVYIQEYSQKEYLERYEVKFDFNYVKNVITCTISSSIISSILPTTYILRYQPKKILMK